jgi:superoxide dismutase
MSENTHEELEEKLHRKISNLTMDGWRVVDKNEKRLECVLDKGGNFNHTVHAILTLFTCVWGIVWYIQYNNNRPKRMRISYDKNGNYNEESMNG